MAVSVKTTRLAKELSSLTDCWPLSGDKMDILQAKIIGAPETPYEEGCFKLRIEIPERYPFEPPRVRFLTKIYHPNIDKQGRICLDILKTTSQSSWRPTFNINTVLTAIKQLMAEPNPNDPLEPEIAEELLIKKDQYFSTARKWTKLYANDNAQNGDNLEADISVDDETGKDSSFASQTSTSTKSITAQQQEPEKSTSRRNLFSSKASQSLEKSEVPKSPVESHISKIERQPSSTSKIPNVKPVEKSNSASKNTKILKSTTRKTKPAKSPSTTKRLRYGEEIYLDDTDEDF